VTTPAPAIAAAQPARTLPPARHVTMKQRVALGFLHTGALFREYGGIWRCRAFPKEKVNDITVRFLERAGLAVLREYEGHHGLRRACLCLTEAGIALYAQIGGKYRTRRPPPVQAEGILRETEIAMGEMAEQEARIAKQLALIDAETRETRAASKRIEERMARLEAKATTFERERAKWASCRQDLHAFTTQAAERIGAAISEAGA